MKILINDHSGHNFTLSLSRQLAKENNIVLHCFSTNFQSPKGHLSKQPTDPDNLLFYPITYKKVFQKYSIISRSFQELEYAKELNKIIYIEKPDVVICANTPLVAQQKILLFCRKTDIPFIYWCQDLYSLAIKKIAIKKIGIFGYLVSIPFELLEKYQLRKAQYIVAITEDFKEEFEKWNIKTSTVVIPNWSSLDDIYRIAGEVPYSRLEGINRTLFWMSKFRNFKFKTNYEVTSK